MTKRSRPLISRKRLGLAVLALGAMQGQAHAAGSTADTMGATASVSAECYIGGAPTMNFGTFGAINGLTATASTPSATVLEGWNCTNGTTGTFAAAADTVTLSGGTAVGSLVAAISNTSFSGAGASTAAMLTGTGASSNTTIYGELTVPTTAKAGSYTGSVNLTITY